MLAQDIVVALLVAACAVYAAWSLLPAAARRGIAVALLKLPLPGPLAARMARHTVITSGCACDGCDRSATTAKPAPGAVAPITFHPRRQR